MAPKSPLPKVTEPKPGPDIHIVGLKKIGPNSYAVVTGTTEHPIVDNVTQPLNYACEAMKLAIHKLLEVVP